jgi:hypothetical protein
MSCPRPTSPRMRYASATIAGSREANAGSRIRCT